MFEISRTLVAVEHLFLNAREIGGDMVRMVAHRGVEVREEGLKQHVGSD